MVIRELSEAETDAIFRALADSTRRDIVRRAIRQEQSISSLAERYAMSFAAVQKHVSVLERTALIGKTRHGKEQIVRANPETLQRAGRLLGEFEQLWRERLDRFGAALAAPQDPTRALTTPSTDTTPGDPARTGTTVTDTIRADSTDTTPSTGTTPTERGHRP